MYIHTVLYKCSSKWSHLSLFPWSHLSPPEQHFYLQCFHRAQSVDPRANDISTPVYSERMSAGREWNLDIGNGKDTKHFFQPLLVKSKCPEQKRRIAPLHFASLQSLGARLRDACSGHPPHRNLCWPEKKKGFSGELAGNGSGQDSGDGLQPL